MNHSFDVDVARKYGVDAAIIIQHFTFWILKNRANGKHFHEGKTWTYCSQSALAILFPYWTEKQIRRIVSGLENDGVLVTGNYNQSAYDRTTWYAFSDESIFLNGLIHSPKRANGKAQTGVPIPDVRTDVEEDNKTDNTLGAKPRASSSSKSSIPKPEGVTDQTWQDYLALRKAKRAPVTQTVINEIEKEAGVAGITINEALSVQCAGGWQGFKADWYKKQQVTVQPVQDDEKRFAQIREVERRMMEGN